MSLRSWLGIKKLTDDVRQHKNDINWHNEKITRLQELIAIQGTQLAEIKELLKMPLDFRLAQAKSSLNLLTSFINEIEHDQGNLANKINLQDQMARRREDANKNL